MMDKSWMKKSRVSQEYIDGVKRFIDLAIERGAVSNGLLKCPCIKCNNVLNQDRETTDEHLICNGIVEAYTEWFYHGEPISSQIGGSSRENLIDAGANVDDMCNDKQAMVHDAFGVKYPVLNGSSSQGMNDIPKENARLNKLLGEVGKEIYPGSKHTNLFCITKLWDIRSKGKFSDKSISMLLKLLDEALPEGHMLPLTFEQTKEIVSALGVEHKKIDEKELQAQLDEMRRLQGGGT